MPQQYRPKDAWADDPLVAIDADVLAAAIAERGETPAGFATRVGVSKQSLAHLLRGGGTKRCRRERRRQFARALRLSEAALEGEPLASPTPWMAAGFEFLHTRHTELAASRLLTSAGRACRRDGYSDQVSLDVQQSLGLLMRVGEWRRRLFQAVESGPSSPTLEPRGHDPWPAAGRRQVDRGHEAAVLALIHSLEYLLVPWLSGEVPLSPESLAQLAGLAEARKRGEVPAAAKSPGRPRKAMQELFDAQVEKTPPETATKRRRRTP